MFCASVLNSAASVIKYSLRSTLKFESLASPPIVSVEPLASRVRALSPTLATVRVPEVVTTD